MTENQKRFADEYIIDLNGTRAYKAAYPNVKSDNVAHACAAKLLRKATISEYITEQLEKIRSEKVADAQEVLEFLTSTMRAEGGIMPKLKAAELLGKRHGLFTDKVDVNVPVTIVIKDDYGDE